MTEDLRELIFVVIAKTVARKILYTINIIHYTMERIRQLTNINLPHSLTL